MHRTRSFEGGAEHGIRGGGGREEVARGFTKQPSEYRRAPQPPPYIPLSGEEDEPHGAAGLIPVAIPIIPSRKSVIRARPAELAFLFPASSSSLTAHTERSVRCSFQRIASGGETPLFAPLGKEPRKTSCSERGIFQMLWSPYPGVQPGRPFPSAAAPRVTKSAPLSEPFSPLRWISQGIGWCLWRRLSLSIRSFPLSTGWCLPLLALPQQSRSAAVAVSCCRL